MSWVVGFGILTVVVAAGLLLFLLGIKRYRRQAPLGSPFTAVAQVFVAAARKWRVKETPDWDVYCGDDERSGGSNMEVRKLKHRTLARTKQFRYTSLFNNIWIDFLNEKYERDSFKMRLFINCLSSHNLTLTLVLIL